MFPEPEYCLPLPPAEGAMPNKNSETGMNWNIPYRIVITILIMNAKPGLSNSLAAVDKVKSIEEVYSGKYCMQSILMVSIGSKFAALITIMISTTKAAIAGIKLSF